MKYINLTQLNHLEKTALQQLMAIQEQGTTVYHFAIRNMVEHGDNYSFWNLCRTLKEAAEDNPHLLKRILGEKAFQAVMALNNEKQIA